MARRALGIVLVGMLMLPIAASAGVIGGSADTTTMCVPLPISTDAKDIHIGDKHIHVPGRTDPKVCVTLDHEVQGTPTVTRYDSCGNSCFAVRVSDVRAYADVKVEVTYKEDGQPMSVPVDPDPIDLTREVDEICVSNHSAGTPDPCVFTITSPSDLRAKGGVRQVNLRWNAAEEAYGRDLDTSYEVWRSTSEDLETFEPVATSVETRFVDSDLAKQTTYYYFVVAVDQKGNRSGGSNLASATTN